ncbi:MAG: lipid-A-disaccharide synthase [Verrucomicrobiales bacterium]
MAQRIYMIAGEASGDTHGAGLMTALLDCDPGIRFAGLGGPAMSGLSGGVRNWTGEAAVVGLWEVLKKYRYFRGQFDRTLDELEDFAPDILVLVDYPGFNLRLAAEARKRGINTRIVHYISPQVWAWKRGRISRMAKILDRILCLFPFEVPLYRNSGLDARFVGHPIAEQLAGLRGNCERDEQLVALLPGSRQREVEKIFPVMLGAAAEMIRLKPGLRFASAAADGELAGRMQTMASAHGVDCPVGVGNAHELMATACCAAVASGTATLESAFLGLPYCIVYRVAWPTYHVARALMAVDYLGMANLLAGRELVREFLQGDAVAGRVAAELLRLSESEEQREELGRELQAVTAPLAEHGAYQRAAAATLEESPAGEGSS